MAVRLLIGLAVGFILPQAYVSALERRYMRRFGFNPRRRR